MLKGAICHVLRPLKDQPASFEAHSSRIRRRPFIRYEITLSIKIAQKPYIIGSLGPKALKYESLDAKG